ncbi:MAG: toxin-antitoxin system HicB family antitoxin [Jatrophihabitantaceae bacterium]
MDLDHYVRQVHDQLTATAALGDERTQQIAGTLSTASASAVRLAILAALSQAADEITAALLDAPGTPVVSVRLDGDAVRVEVVSSEPGPAATRTDDGDASARISLRLAESLKADVEQAAGRDGVSVNTWLVRAASTALTPTSPPGFAGPGGRGPVGRESGPGGRRNNNAHHITGWING